MLHQIRPAGSPAADSWRDCGSTSALYCLCMINMVLTLYVQRPDQNELSLALVPRDHPLIPPPNLEPEASGLLDRLLDVFNEQPR